MRLLFVLVGCVLISTILSSCLDSGGNTFDSSAQFKNDTTAISTYLSTFFIPATKSPYGVWWEIDNPGTGHYPTYPDTVVVNYTGNLLSSTGPTTQFDQQTNAKILTLTSVIAGWQIGLPRIQVGATGKLYIPSYYAYGNTPNNSIPANSNLVFTIQVVSTSGYQLGKDITAIDSYISTNSIANVIQDPSGLRYTIDTLGTGPKALAGGHIIATYSGKIIPSSGAATSFGTFSTPTRYYLPGMINAWGILLPQIKEGSTVTMYVPSGLAYSVFPGDNGIPANSNLIYQIRMTKVLP
jgi:FKBP-type peptidyl-prolyl cis-trans isomerase FkpA